MFKFIIHMTSDLNSRPNLVPEADHCLVVTIEHLLQPTVDPARERKSDGSDGRPKVEESTRSAQDGHPGRDPTQGSDHVRSSQDHIESFKLAYKNNLKPVFLEKELSV